VRRGGIARRGRGDERAAGRGLVRGRALGVAATAAGEEEHGEGGDRARHTAIIPGGWACVVGAMLGTARRGR
jgi:hypothetical protein